MNTTINKKSDRCKFAVRTGARGKPDPAAIPIVDDDRAHKGHSTQNVPLHVPYVHAYGMSLLNIKTCSFTFRHYQN